MGDQSGRSYSMKRHTPVIPGGGQRARCSMMLAIANRGQLCFRVFNGQLNSDVFIDFLRRLKRQSDRKNFLIVDRHRVHRSGKTRKWIDKHAAKFRLIFLPVYSTDLNPDEMLNQDCEIQRRSQKASSQTLTHDRQRPVIFAQQTTTKIHRRTLLSGTIRTIRRTLTMSTI